MADWATLGVSPPTDKTDRLQTGRFVRAMLVRTLALVVPVWIIVFLMDAPKGDQSHRRRFGCGDRVGDRLAVVPDSP